MISRAGIRNFWLSHALHVWIKNSFIAPDGMHDNCDLPCGCDGSFFEAFSLVQARSPGQ